jgi:hypothetical protein
MSLVEESLGEPRESRGRRPRQDSEEEKKD